MAPLYHYFGFSSSRAGSSGLTRKRQGILFHGSGTLFNPMRGVVRTRCGAIAVPAERNKPLPGSHKSTPFRVPSMDRAWVSLAGPFSQPGSACQVRPVGSHPFLPCQRADGADQNRRRRPFNPSDRIHHPMHAIGEINIGEAWRSVHDRVPAGLAGMGMAAQVILAQIGFCFGDDTAQAVTVHHADELRTQELAGNLRRGPVKKGTLYYLFFNQ